MSGKSSATLSVEEIMTPESVLKTVTPEDTVLAAMELMIDNNFRHVPVVRRPVLSTRPSRNSCPEARLDDVQSGLMMERTPHHPLCHLWSSMMHRLECMSRLHVLCCPVDVGTTHHLTAGP